MKVMRGHEEITYRDPKTGFKYLSEHTTPEMIVRLKLEKHEDNGRAVWQLDDKGKVIHCVAIYTEWLRLGNPQLGVGEERDIPDHQMKVDPPTPLPWEK